ncbi:hypothetical protein [Phormidium sp. CCY1219]|uniref:hypothetical protein n=1 Tax=Phormidium sp. CCY1219 TaxID=2886104 RepID=UPI002D1EBA35|nr:hypothetical protein [Phormidium sp. CCY1219]MEB3827494.1 hypothetical protein [Phormidium sp. CCY1219]
MPSLLGRSQNLLPGKFLTLRLQNAGFLPQTTIILDRSTTLENNANPPENMEQPNKLADASVYSESPGLSGTP